MANLKKELEPTEENLKSLRSNDQLEVMQNGVTILCTACHKRSGKYFATKIFEDPGKKFERVIEFDKKDIKKIIRDVIENDECGESKKPGI